MKIDSKGYITLTPRESAEIIECLETLEAMSAYVGWQKIII